MFKVRTRSVSLTLILSIMLTLIAACGGAAPAADNQAGASVAASTATEASAAASTAAASTATEASAAASASTQAAATGNPVALSTNPADYSLQPDKPYDGTKLKFLVCCSTVGQFAALIERTNQEFTPMTGIEVEWDNTPWDSFQQKLLTEATTGSGTYDVVAWVDSWGQGIKPYLVPLDERIKEANIDMSDFPKAYLEAGSGEDGAVYGLPFRGHAQVLFYRKDVFEELGLTPPQTWEEVSTAAQTISEKTELNPISMYYGVGNGQNLFIWLNLLWGSGGEIFDESMRPVFNNEAGVKATEQYVAFVKNNLTNQAALTFGEGEATEEMTKGRAAMFVGWSWIYENFTNPEIAAPEVLGNVGVVPAPSNGGDPVSYGYIWPTGILQSSNNPDAAWEYLKWMTSKPVDKAVALDKSDPKTSNIVVTHLSNLKDPEINATTNGLHEVMGTMLETARTQPLIAEWPEVQSTLEIAINEIAGGADVQATLDRAQQEVDAIMKRGGYYQ